LQDHNAEVNIIKSLPILVGDRIRLAEVFQNLIINGIKYNINQKKEIRIDFTETHDEYIFSVSDNGIGIAKHQYEQIFEIFKCLNPRSAFEGGTGLGATIAQKIIEQHKGRIWLESEEGQGSTFYFSIDKALNINPETKAG